MTADRPYKVAVFIETSRGYGRALCEGIADFAQANGHWAFEGGGESWEQGLYDLSPDIDGVIARIRNRNIANLLSGPTVSFIVKTKIRDACSSSP